MKRNHFDILLTISVFTIGCATLTPSLHAQFVYVMNASGDTISASRIEPDGQLTAIGSAAAPGGRARALVVASGAKEHGSGHELTSRFVYALNNNFPDQFAGPNFVAGYRIESNGGLTP